MLSVQRRFRREFGLNPPTRSAHLYSYKQFILSGCLWKGNSFKAPSMDSAKDVQTQPAKIFYTYRWGIRHTLADSAENSQEALTVEVNQLSRNCCVMNDMALSF